MEALESAATRLAYNQTLQSAVQNLADNGTLQSAATSLADNQTLKSAVNNLADNGTLQSAATSLADNQTLKSAVNNLADNETRAFPPIPQQVQDLLDIATEAQRHYNEIDAKDEQNGVKAKRKYSSCFSL